MNDSSLAPLHLHIAEQAREVDECIAAYGKRPVDWLLDEVALSSRHVLVHATHMTDAEVSRLAASGAVVVVCPSTEGNLGDGFFDFVGYRAAQGSWCIGSDSHVGMSPMEELRWLDYGARLRAQKRNLACASGNDSGQTLLEEAWFGGRCAAGEAHAGPFEIGAPFDALELDELHPAIASKDPRRILAGLIYAADPGIIATVWRCGRVVVKDGRHIAQRELRGAFARVIATLARE